MHGTPQALLALVEAMLGLCDARGIDVDPDDLAITFCCRTRRVLVAHLDAEGRVDDVLAHLNADVSDEAFGQPAPLAHGDGTMH